MHLDPGLRAPAERPAPPRTVGALSLSSKRRDGTSCLDTFRSAGALRATFPRRRDALDVIVVNTSGGLAGGDRLEIEAAAGPGSRLVVTTQAAERAYRSNSGAAVVRSRLDVAAGAALAWLPQELILFDGAALDRRLEVNVAEGGEFVMAEPVIFGRTAMGETVRRLSFEDRVTVSRAHQPLYRDKVALDGDIVARLAGTATAGGLGAMASALYVGPRAAALLGPLRACLPRTGGASLLGAETLAVRLLAPDGYHLRVALCPALEVLSGATLPKSWRL